MLNGTGLTCVAVDHGPSIDLSSNASFEIDACDFCVVAGCCLGCWRILYAILYNFGRGAMGSTATIMKNTHTKRKTNRNHILFGAL